MEGPPTSSLAASQIGRESRWNSSLRETRERTAATSTMAHARVHLGEDVLVPCLPPHLQFR